MNPVKKLLLSTAFVAIVSSTFFTASAEKLVILHTNDTHSQIDPNDNDMGGILRRKVVIDSVRAADKNVLVIDAGDIVQGTLYFNLYKGEVENMFMNALGYDMRILGNHEFDNGVDELAANLANAKAELLSTNYELSSSPLAKEFKPYTIRTFGGKRIGFLAINLNPEGIIAKGNYDGVNYLDAIESANAMAWYLKNLEHCDYVIALTHIGYKNDYVADDITLAQKTKNINLIIGGHSHTLIDASSPKAPQYRFANLDGDTVTIAQISKGGVFLGHIDFDLNNGNIKTSVIPINSRLDNRIDKTLAESLVPYRQGVDSLMSTPYVRSTIELIKTQPPLQNFITDFVRDNANTILKIQKTQGKKSVDFAIMNKGGIRRSFPKGNISEGMIITMLPFANRTVVVDIKGSDIYSLLEVMAQRDGDMLSSEMEVVYAIKDGKSQIISALLNGKPIDRDATYRVATIDYLANGGDYMRAFTNGTQVAVSDSVLFDDLLKYLKTNYKKKAINPSKKVRMKRAEN